MECSLRANRGIGMRGKLKEQVRRGARIGGKQGESGGGRRLGREIFEHILRVASGERSKSEQLGYGDNEFVPWQIGATM